MIFDSRNLVYGDGELVLNIVQKPYTLIAVGDYHDGYLLSKIDLFLYPDEIYFIPSYNKQQFRKAVQEALKIGLPTVILNIHRIFKIDHFNELNNIIYTLLNQRELEVFITTKEMKSRKYPPEPYAPHYIRHMVDVVAYSKRVRGGYSIYLTKHPTLPYIKIYIPISGGNGYGEKLPILQRLA